MINLLYIVLFVVGFFLLVIILKLIIAIPKMLISKEKRRKKKVINQVLTPLLEEVFGSDMIYDQNGRIEDEVIKESGFISSCDVISGSDLVQCRYKGVPLTFSDVRIQSVEEKYNHKTKSTETTYTTQFKGSWVVADFDIELSPVPLKLVEERSRYSIKMESAAFNDKFSVYCSDAHTAFYILTPHFIERLISFEKKAAGKMYILLYKNRLQFATHSYADKFELSFFKKENVEAMETQFREEIKQITDLLDEILLHERLFGKTDYTSETAVAAGQEEHDLNPSI